MNVHEVLARCREAGVSLRLDAKGILRQRGADTELLAGLQAHRQELRAIVGAKSWPWLGFPNFDLAKARCRCGDPPHEFSERGEPVCEHPEKSLEGAGHGAGA